MSINLGSIDILIILNLLTHKHSMCLYLFRSSMASSSMFYKFQHIDIMYYLLDIYLVVYFFWSYCEWYCAFDFGFPIVQC